MTPETAALLRWIVTHDPGKRENETDAAWHDRLSNWHAGVHATARTLLGDEDMTTPRRIPHGKKVDNVTALRIRQLLALGLTQDVIARRVGVSRGVVARVKRGSV